MAGCGRRRQVTIGLGLWLLLLPARLGEAVAPGGNTTSGNDWTKQNSLVNVTSGAACRQACPELDDYTNRMRLVLDSKPNQAQLCHAVQVDHALVGCISAWPATCVTYWNQFDQTKTECKKIGIDISQPPPLKSNYTALTCLMCVESMGASKKKAYWDKPDLHTCEVHCGVDPTCAAFDYDPTRNFCRTWTACPPSTRSSRFGCEWTVYLKPGFVEQSPRHGTSPVNLQNFDYWGNQEAENTTRPPHGMLAVTDAAPHGEPLTCWLAISALYLVATLASAT